MPGSEDKGIDKRSKSSERKFSNGPAFDRRCIEQDAAGSKTAGGAGALRRRLALLAYRNFRIFFAGYATSLIGSAMARIAVAYAVLGDGGGSADLGYVFAAGVVPQVVVMVGGGVLADRLGRRPVMLVTDATRLAVQGTLAVTLFAGRPPIWLIAVLCGVMGASEGFFSPALGGLKTEIVPAGKLTDGNALLGLVRSAASVTGPALAGVLIAVTSPAVVIAIDAGSYGASVLALSLLAIPAVGPATQSPWRDLADGWRQFRAVTWLWLTTLQFALFNLFTWAPYLLLGPILARAYLGGASAWGAIMAAFAGGSVLGGMLAMGRHPHRPLVIATAATFGYSLPCLLLAVRAPALAVACGALAAGTGGAVSATFSATVVQERLPRDMLARISAFQTTGSFALGSVGFVLVGPVAALVGTDRLLSLGAAYSILSSAVILALPAIWSVQSRDTGGGCVASNCRSAPRRPDPPTVGCRTGSVGSAEMQREGRSA